MAEDAARQCATRTRSMMQKIATLWLEELARRWPDWLAKIP
jgi:hypothetical protein